jgi:hypothetical protein
MLLTNEAVELKRGLLLSLQGWSKEEMHLADEAMPIFELKIVRFIGLATSSSTLFELQHDELSNDAEERCACGFAKVASVNIASGLCPLLELLKLILDLLFVSRSVPLTGWMIGTGP